MAPKKFDELVSIENYLAGELVSEIKHEYLGGAIHAMAGAKMRHNQVTSSVHTSLGNSIGKKRCRPFNSDATGAFQKEAYRDLSETISLPEIEAELPLADIYDGLEIEEN